MCKKEVMGLSLAFLLGILLTLLLSPNSNNGRYIPFGPDNRILDTQNGRMFARSAVGQVWVLQAQKVDKKHNK